MMEMEEHAEEYETSLKRVQESLQAYPELEIKILPDQHILRNWRLRLWAQRRDR